MKVEDGNMLWICMLKIRGFGWIMVWWKTCVFWGIIRKVSEMYLNGLELVDKYENVDIGWKVWS